MSVVKPRVAAFEKAFKSLSREARLVALGYGLVHPCKANDGQMAQALREAGFERQGKAIPAYRYKQATEEAVKSGFVVGAPGPKGALIAPPERAPWLALQARRQGDLERIEEAWDSSGAHAMWHERRAAKFRRDVVAGRWDEAKRFADFAAAKQWHWLACPGAESLLDSLPDGVRDPVFAVVLDHVVKEALPPEPMLAMARERYSKWSLLVADEAFVRVLQGDFDGALAVFDRLPPEIRESKAARVSRFATRALVATLKGDDAEAIEGLEAAVDADKAGTKRRNVFPPVNAFVLALLSLVRDRTARNAVELHRLLVAGRKAPVDLELYAAVARAVAARDGRDPDPSPAWSSFACVVDGWESLWIGDPEAIGDVKREVLQDLARRAFDNGYLWLAAECFLILDWLGVRPSAGIGGEALDPGPAGAAMLDRMGAVPLASVVEPAPEWEYPLRELERFAFETRRKPKRKKRKGKAATGPGRRLVWELSPSRYGFPRVAAREQRLYKSGKWSKGRQLSLGKLFSDAPSMEHLTDHDRAVAATIARGARRSPYPSHYVPAKGLYALAGHPLVFNDGGDSVEVARREVELTIEEVDGDLSAKVRPHTDMAVSKTYDVVMTSETRCEVVRFTAAQKRLCRIVPPEGLALPGDSRDRLFDSVSALADEVRVQGDAGAGAEFVKRVDGDAEPWVRLEPSGEGLAVALVVEPVPGSSAYFRPGVGGRTVIARVNGESVQATRALEAEDERERELRRACPMLDGLGPESSMALSEPGDCLRLVDELGVAEARCLWPKGQPFKVVSRADTSSLRVQVRSAAEWFDASGELAVDKERAVDLRRLLELVDKSRDPRFVALGDGEFVALTDRLRRQLKDLGSLGRPRGKESVRLHAMAALALRDFLDGTRLTADSGWEERRERLRAAQALEPRTPSTLQAELRPYQEEGFRWLARLSHWGVGACLADDMGLGKTVQTLAVLLERAPKGPALVVAPTSVVANWVDEARRFAPTLAVRVYAGSVSSRASLLDDLGPFDLVITTYGLLHVEADALTEVEWSTAVLDEAQAIKNAATKRARAARRLNADFRVTTTGTPVQNNLMDLHSLFAFLNPGLLGSAKRFRETFALPVERDGDPEARARLRRLIAPFVLRRLKADVLDDLPARTEVTLEVEMSEAEASLYEALRRRAIEDLSALSDDDADAGPGRLQVLAHLTRLRLACCNPRLVHPDGSPPASSKLATFAETLDELRQGNHKVLVFSQFVRHLKLVEERLVEKGIPYQYLDGSTSAKARAERIAAFQAGDGDAFLISLRAGGVGLNLTAADYVIHMDPWWNPAAEDQASDRAHRIGQTRPVTIYRLVAKGTIEERIVDLHRHKRDLADRLLEGADAPARLSADELLELLRGPEG